MSHDPDPTAAVVGDGVAAPAPGADLRDPVPAAAPTAPAGATDAEAVAAPEVDAAQAEAIAALLRRLARDSDFPALSASMRRVQQLTASESQTVQGVAEAILQDVALTAKLLRLVNTAHFHRGGEGGHDDGGITSLSRAVALVGFAGIRNLALSLVLLEHLNDRGHAALLVEEFVRVLMAGLVAAELAPLARDAEDAFLAALLQQLGRLLAARYFPAEAARIRAALDDPGADAEAVSARVLGAGFAPLGLAAAHHWGLPAALLQRLQRPHDAPPRRAVPPPQRLRWTARAAGDCTDALLDADVTRSARRLAREAEAHARTLGVDAASVVDATRRARARLVEMVAAMGLRVPPAAAAARLLAGPPAPTQASGSGTPAAAAPRTGPATPPATPPTPPEADADALSARPGRSAPARDAERAVARLSAGVEAVAHAMAQDEVELPALLRRVLQTMLDALPLQRAVLCVRDAASGELRGRLGVGSDAAALCPHFRVSVEGTGPAAPDLFTTLCRQGLDTLIDDAASGGIAARLPRWFAQHVQAPTFLVLPLMRRGAPIGMIYGDAARAGAIAPDGRELALLRTLRDQALMALRQAAASTTP